MNIDLNCRNNQGECIATIMSNNPILNKHFSQFIKLIFEHGYTPDQNFLNLVTYLKIKPYLKEIKGSEYAKFFKVVILDKVQFRNLQLLSDELLILLMKNYA